MASHEITSPKRLAWITGASSGIGRALALRLAADGWKVIVSARGQDKLDALAAQAPAGKIVSMPLDVTDRQAVAEAVSAIESAHGPIDLAVLSAGTYKRESARGFDAGALSDMVTLNIVGTGNCLEAIMPRMIERKAGHIGVISSVAGYVGLPGGAGYGATKAALINLCEGLYPELQLRNVKLSLINPGFVDTPLTERNDFPMPFLISAEEAADHIAKGLASGRFEIIFPWKMAFTIKLLNLLPRFVTFAITRRMVRKQA